MENFSGKFCWQILLENIWQFLLANFSGKYLANFSGKYLANFSGKYLIETHKQQYNKIGKGVNTKHLLVYSLYIYIYIYDIAANAHSVHSGCVRYSRDRRAKTNVFYIREFLI